MYYKVPAYGKMTSSNIKNTCEKNGFVNTCVGPSSCTHSGSGCTITSLTGCGNPMRDLSRSICNGNNPNNCPKLYGVFAYMYNYASDESCYADNNVWSCSGKQWSDKFALCAIKIG